MKAATFDISPADGDQRRDHRRPARGSAAARIAAAQSDARRQRSCSWWSPPEPLRAGREYEFEFRYSGNVIHDAGDRVFFVSGARQLVSDARRPVRRLTT